VLRSVERNSPPTLTVSDGVNSYTLVGTTSNAFSATNSSAYMWLAKNVAGGATTVTVTSSLTADLDLIVLEYSGASTSNPIDSSGVGKVVSNGASSTVGGYTPAFAPLFVNEALVCYSYDQSHSGDTFTFSTTPPLSFTSRQTTSNSGGESSSVADSIGTFTSGAYAPAVLINAPGRVLYEISCLLTDRGTALAYPVLPVPVGSALSGGTTGVAYSETPAANHHSMGSIFFMGYHPTIEPNKSTVFFC
jgi:hypothetical protein